MQRPVLTLPQHSKSIEPRTTCSLKRRSLTFDPGDFCDVGAFRGGGRSGTSKTIHRGVSQASTPFALPGVEFDGHGMDINSVFAPACSCSSRVIGRLTIRSAHGGVGSDSLVG